MKKIFIGTLALALLIGTVSAQNVTQSQQQTAQALTAEIKQLQQERKAALSKIITQLKRGARSDAVKNLQQILALDPEVYPEGMVTGYYGPLTAKAVRKFQEKNGLPQVGVVGPQTVEKLKKFIEDSQITVDTATTSTTEGTATETPKLCAIVPPGHFIAPGWLKKNNGVKPTLPSCQTLPAGIAAKLGTVTPPGNSDKTAPTISVNSITNITATSATLTITANEPVTVKVWNGTVNPTITTGTPQAVTTAAATHSIPLSGLTADTNYYYVVEVSDIAGNKTTTAQTSFKTTIITDTIIPVISAITETDITNAGAKISFTTNENTTAKIWYSTTANVVTTGTPTMAIDTAGMSHSFTLTGLTANTPYFYIIEVTDSASNKALSSEDTFTTLQ